MHGTVGPENPLLYPRQRLLRILTKIEPAIRLEPSYNVIMLSEIALEHYRNPRNAGPMSDATHFGTAGCRGDGPYVEIWLKIDGDTIEKASYRTPGCPSSTAAASLLAQLATGRTAEQAKRITAADLLLILGGLPEGKQDYAERSVNALNAAFASPSAGLGTQDSEREAARFKLDGHTRRGSRHPSFHSSPVTFQVGEALLKEAS